MSDEDTPLIGTPSIQGLFVFMWTSLIDLTFLYRSIFVCIVIAILALKNALILYLNRSHDFAKDYASHEQIPIRHIVAISCYKEPVELIAKNVQTLAYQTEVHRITMIISFEQRTPDKEKEMSIIESTISKLWLRTNSIHYSSIWFAQ